ncbi:Hr39 [Bugula neritina]|uniref:Hr39 n=1 Tax=Bugula neritina TaxID=10212 RepID=A0A7J7JB00_BUGNE|nr:Hr39 [Bugula neritina]
MSCHVTDTGSIKAGDWLFIIITTRVTEKAERERRELIVSSQRFFNELEMNSDKAMSAEITPPQLLQELVALEKYYEECSTTPQPCCANRMTEKDQHKFNSLLHLTEHRLHQVVRWARRLPHFANFDINDQVLLLKNSWAELICFGVVWRSRDAEGFVRLSYGKTIDMKKAKEMNHEENIGRVIYVSTTFRKMKVDVYEYVAVKVLSTLLPDIAELMDSEKIQKVRNDTLEALQLYISEKHPESPLRFAELLFTISEVQRLTALTRQQILELPPTEVARNSILAELLQHNCPKSVPLTEEQALRVIQTNYREFNTSKSSHTKLCRSQSIPADFSSPTNPNPIVA